MLGVQYAKGGNHSGGGAPAPTMVWHDGEIMPDAVVQAIFWGTNWGTDAAFTADKLDGIDSLYVGFESSNYALTNTEYTGSNGQVSATVTYDGHVIDNSAGPNRSPRTSDILAEVCKMISDPVPNGYYPVYTDTPRGHAGYCAWHSYGACDVNGASVPIQFAFFFDLDGDAGCDPVDGSGLHSQGLAALANVTGHEYSEAVTDPRNGGWYDSQGSENADKCAWSFGAPLITLSNASQWKIQGNWSNAAYNTNEASGSAIYPGSYANRDGELGCLSGA
jgi:hypothetical protein